jgi:hypothetical protein
VKRVTRKGLEKDVLKLFEDLGRPVHIGDLKKKYRVLTKSRSSKKGMTERELLAWNLRRLYKAGRLSRSDRLARIREYPVSPYARDKKKRVVNVRFYAPPECAGKTLSFEVNGESYEFYFVRYGMLEERPSMTKKEMVVSLLKRSDRALTTNEILEGIVKEYNAYELRSKKDFYNAASSLNLAVLRKLLREGLHGRKYNGRWIWYYTEDQLVRYMRHLVESDPVLRTVKDMVRSERCVPLARVASVLRATPAEVRYRVKKTGKFLPVKVKTAITNGEVKVEVEVGEFKKDSLLRWLGVVVPRSENGYGYETMLVDLDSDWEEALREQIRRSLSRIHVKTLVGYFYEKLVAKLFQHLCTSRELQEDPVLSRYMIPFVFRSERVVNVWTTMDSGRRAEFDVLIRGTFRAFDVIAQGKTYLDLVIPVESKYTVVSTEHVTSFDEKIQRVFGDSRNVLPVMIGLSWREDALTLARRFGFMPIYFSSLNHLISRLTGTDYRFKDEWRRVEEKLNTGEISLEELRRLINDMRIKYLFEELLEKRIGRELRDSAPMKKTKEEPLVEKAGPGEKEKVKREGKDEEWGLAPMLAFQAGGIGEILSGHPVLAWEHKINGIRLLAAKKDGEVRLYTRKGRDVTESYGEIALEVLRGVEAEECVLDGELLAVSPAGRPLPPQELLKKRRDCGLRYCVFDVLRVDGADIRDYSYEERRRVLETRVKGGGLSVVSRIISGDEAEILRNRARLGLQPGAVTGEALEKAARYAGKHDLRLGIELLRESGEIALEENAAEIREEHVEAAAKRLTSTGEEDMPRGCREIYEALHVEKGRSMGEVYHAVKEKVGSYSTFSRRVDELQRRGLIKTEMTTKQGRTRLLYRRP